jgi:endonuclease YncB( thermonuclease family)
MKRKILHSIVYSIGAIFGLFILLALLIPKPEPATGAPAPVQHVEQTTQAPTPIEAANISTTTPMPELANSSPPLFTYYSVLSVVDGDTVKIRMNGNEETIRLIGMDTPETVDPRKPVQCFGREASNKAKELLSGIKVHIEMDASQGNEINMAGCSHISIEKMGFFIIDI